MVLGGRQDSNIYTHVYCVSTKGRKEERALEDFNKCTEVYNIIGNSVSICNIIFYGTKLIKGNNEMTTTFRISGLLVRLARTGRLL